MTFIHNLHRQRDKYTTHPALKKLQSSIDFLKQRCDCHGNDYDDQVDEIPSKCE